MSTYENTCRGVHQFICKLASKPVSMRFTPNSVIICDRLNIPCKPAYSVADAFRYNHTPYLIVEYTVYASHCGTDTYTECKIPLSDMQEYANLIADTAKTLQEIF